MGVSLPPSPAVASGMSRLFQKLLFPPSANRGICRAESPPVLQFNEALPLLF